VSAAARLAADARLFATGRRPTSSSRRSLAGQDAPVLFVVSGGQNRIVNYRMKGNMMIVDYTSTRRSSSPASAGARRRSRSGGEGGDATLSHPPPIGLPVSPCFAAASAGCQTLGGTAWSPVRAAELSACRQRAIAGDMVSRLAEHVGPGTGTIMLKPDGSPFGQALEASLKGWGYAS
jgi:hypothetical protein